MNLLQQRVSSGIIAAASVWICWISFSASPSEAYLFPRLISVAFVVFALLTFANALLGKRQTGEGLTMREVLNAAPGFVIAAIYVFWAAKFFGFYTATAVTFFVLLSIYDPAPHGEIKSWIKRVVISAVFIAIMYALFAKLLFVFTPRGMFI